MPFEDRPLSPLMLGPDSVQTTDEGEALTTTWASLQHGDLEHARQQFRLALEAKPDYDDAKLKLERVAQALRGSLPT